MEQIISSIRLVPTHQMVFHEDEEPDRLEKLVNTIRKEQVLHHPPLAVELSDGRFMILDGLHRTKSLIRLGCRYLVVQVVHSDYLRLESWSHLIDSDQWLTQLPPSVCYTPSIGSTLIAQCDLPNGEQISFYPSFQSLPSLTQRLNVWFQVVNSYKNYSYCRIPSSESPILPAGKTLVRFPSLSLNELIEIVQSGCVVPAGVTRCSYHGRVLNLRVPLSFLFQKKVDLYEWRSLVTNWSKALRYYAEPVYICE